MASHKFTQSEVPFMSAYGKKPSHQSHFPPDELSRTKQSDAASCDINLIMAKFEKTATLDHYNTHEGSYGDFINYPDYHTAQNQILAADAAFASLPSKIRARFANDASLFLEFATDPSNIDEMVSMGLSKASPVPPPADNPPDVPLPLDPAPNADPSS